ncbi:MAG: alpha/beta hydrolase [Algicola sp.]|nr:alpha/beta hydrolase [Algicola sp.]
MRRVLLLLLFMALALSACSGAKQASKGQGVVTIVVNVPDNTPQDAVLTLGGDFNSWDPLGREYALTRLDDGAYQYVFAPVTVGKTLHFKLTRGNWETVEIDSDGNNRANRIHIVAAGMQTITLKVADWADLTKKTPSSTIVGEVILKTLELPTFPGKRTVRIYLPPDYHTSQKRYPVIYMSDGQNLFDKSIATAGEWQMDELMARLHDKGSALTSIVVGIDHAGSNRRGEYSPFDYDGDNLFGLDEGKGRVFADWLVGELKPWVDKTWRTKSGRQDTTVMGSSMGGLIALYTGIRHQQTFSRIAGLSSALMYSLIKDNMVQFVTKTGRVHPMKIYFDIGTEETGLMTPAIFDDTKRVQQALLAAGFDANEVKYALIQGGLHSEDSWRSRSEAILRWLYNPPVNH